jgi:hypothetical protein
MANRFTVCVIVVNQRDPKGGHMVDLKKGIFDGISNRDYHCSPAISKSGMDLIARSPLHYYTAILDPNREVREETASMAFGTAVHTAILEPETYRERYVVMPKVDKRTKEGKNIAEAFEAEAAAKGATLITQVEDEKIDRIMHSVHDHPVAQKLLSTGVAEQSCFWRDAETDVWCRVRPDWLIASPLAIVDLKTTPDGSLDAFRAASWKWRYYVQAAFYLDGVAAATGDRPDSFMFLVVEKEAPFAVSVFYADEEFIAAGRAEYRRCLRIYADCFQNNKWPGYDTAIQPIGLPKWASVTEEAA